MVDSVRGLTNVLEPNQTRADSTGITNGITATSSTGFALGNSGDFNSNGRTYVAWCWKAGGAAASNTDGSITSSVSANANYGFSVVSYTGNATQGASVGHGLSTAPSWIIVKRKDAATNWAVGHSGLELGIKFFILI